MTQDLDREKPTRVPAFSRPQQDLFAPRDPRALMENEP